MLKCYNGCKRDLEIDIFYSYKKSTCKKSVNKKVICDYCDEKNKSTSSSEHIKQRHSTHDSSKTNDITCVSTRTIDKTYVSTRTSGSNFDTSISSQKKDSTSNGARKKDSTIYETKTPILKDYKNSRKNIISYDKKKMYLKNSLLDQARTLNNKLPTGLCKQKLIHYYYYKTNEFEII